MLKIIDHEIHLNRGDICTIRIKGTKNRDSGEVYVFQPGDIIRFTISEKGDNSKIVLQKDFLINEESEYADLALFSEDTKIGEVINKPVTYWYTVELNPDTMQQTLIGYHLDGPAVFVLYPEGGPK